MKKPYINYIVDAGLALSFLIVVITGIIKWPGLYRYFKFSGATMRLMTFLHDWIGLLMTLLVLIHLILHWRWIVRMTKNIFGKNKAKRKKKK